MKFIKSRFAKCNSGVAALEFAILLPFLLLVVFGVYEVTTYITASRKIDNVTNDIAYIISREGNIAPLDGSVPGCPVGTYCGGQQRLHDIFDNVIPFLMHPYPYNPGDNKSQIRASVVGLPIPSCNETLTSQNSDGIDRQTARIMWTEHYPVDSAVTVPYYVAGISGCVGPECPDVCNKPSFGKYLSTITDQCCSRANIVYPGQSYVLIDFAYQFPNVLGSSFAGYAPTMKNTFSKLVSYASRSRLIINPNTGTQQMVNNLHYCTDCYPYSSDFKQANHQGLTPPNNGFNVYFRYGCIKDDPSNPLALRNDNEANRGGCTF